jgi:hypothetical protein
MRLLLNQRILISQSTWILIAGFFSGLAQGAFEKPSTNHEIVIVSWDPYHRWLGREVGRFDAIHSVPLPWRDPVNGGADPFIGVTRKGHVYATTASLPQLLQSTDSGQTWASRKLVLDPPHRDGGVQSFAILSDDTFLLAYQVDKRVFVSRSDDLGESWKPSVYIDPSPYEYVGGGTHGFMLELPDGTVLLPLGHYWENQEEIAGALFVYRSSDKGRTWGDGSRVTFWGWEADLQRLESGRLLVAVRYQRCPGCILPSDPRSLAETLEFGYPKQVYLGQSDDNGYTWRRWQQLTEGTFDAPGELLQLPDGTLVLLYAHRSVDPAPCGTWAMISRDDGRTWESDRYIINSECYRKTDWGFCASTVLPDGSILTLSGCRGGGWPNRPALNQKNPGQIRAIRWRLP